MSSLPPTPLRLRLALLGCAALLVALGLSVAWVGDDAYIAFRYARNLADGHGLRFNLGEATPVEGYTQLAWVLIAAAVERAHLPIVATTHAIELALGATLVLVTARAALVGPLAAGEPGARRVAALVSALVLATSPGLIVWSTGGLGTALFALVIFLAAQRVLAAGRDGSIALAAVLVCAITLVRFDGPFFVAAIVLGGMLAGWLTSNARLVRASFVSGAAAVAAFGVQTGWRLAYHGDWVPNTARAKGAFGLRTLERGFDYLLSNWMTVPLLAVGLALLCALAWRDRRSCPAPVVAASVVGAASVYGVLVGGDFMPMGRFFVPALPFIAWGIGRAVAALAKRSSVAPRLATLGAVVLSFPAFVDVSLFPASWRAATTFRWSWDYESERQFLEGVTNRAQDWSRLGRALGARVEPTDSLVRGPIGAVGYHSRMVIYDLFGLTDREVTSTIVPDPAAMTLPGHDCKAPHGFFNDRNPTWLEARLVEGTELDEVNEAGLRFAENFGVLDVFELGPADGFDDRVLLVLQRLRPRPGSEADKASSEAEKASSESEEASAEAEGTSSEADPAERRTGANDASEHAAGGGR